jgi:hypothetical protein
MVSLGDILLTVGIASGGAAFWLWRETRTIDEDYNEDYEQLRNYRAGQFRAELTDVFTDVVDEIDLVRFQMGRDDYRLILEATNAVVTRDAMETVETALRQYDSLAEQLRTAEDQYSSSMRWFMFATGSGVIGGLVGFIPDGMPGIAANDLIVLQLMLTGFLILVLGSAAQDAWEAFKLERELKSQIRQYKNEKT